ncbi:MAG: hypothetical protein JST79_11910 [Acidobacteria bacterium]|nr:hypothetical protein [Acidobacteriota bacterium]
MGYDFHRRVLVLLLISALAPFSAFCQPGGPTHTTAASVIGRYAPHMEPQIDHPVRSVVGWNGRLSPAAAATAKLVAALPVWRTGNTSHRMSLVLLEPTWQFNAGHVSSYTSRPPPCASEIQL